METTGSLSAVSISHFLGGYQLDQHLTRSHGLEGKYYANPNWQGNSQFITVDPEISSILLKEQREKFPENRFSVVWNGFVVIEKSGGYTFQSISYWHYKLRWGLHL